MGKVWPKNWKSPVNVNQEGNQITGGTGIRSPRGTFLSIVNHFEQYKGVTRKTGIFFLTGKHMKLPENTKI